MKHKENYGEILVPVGNTFRKEVTQEE